MSDQGPYDPFIFVIISIIMSPFEGVGVYCIAQSVDQSVRRQTLRTHSPRIFLLGMVVDHD